tara:strand:+ start:476 stop:685 length:210 start_codon:yes stop_codon:yes gene_type:complete
MAEKSGIAVIVAGLASGGTGLAAWVDLNVGVADNKNQIEKVEQTEQIHRDYIKEKLLSIEQLVKDLEKT